MPKTTSKRPPPAPSLVSPLHDHRTILARHLDLIAGIELQHGHHRQAEHLAHRAALLQEVAR